MFWRHLENISWYSEIWKYIWVWISITSSAARKETGQTNQIDWYLFVLKGCDVLCILFFLVLEWKWESGIQYWLILIFTLWLSIFNLGILKVACQKKLQEDGRGGEGVMADNIWGEVGSIPPYPTFIPPGPKKLFCRQIKMSPYFKANLFWKTLNGHYSSTVRDFDLIPKLRARPEYQLYTAWLASAFPPDRNRP